MIAQLLTVLKCFCSMALLSAVFTIGPAGRKNDRRPALLLFAVLFALCLFLAQVYAGGAS